MRSAIRLRQLSIALLTLSTIEAVACPPGFAPGMSRMTAMPGMPLDGAMPPDMGGGMPSMHMPPPLPQFPDLSEAQHDALFTQMQALAKPRHEAMRAATTALAALRQIAKAPRFDEANAKELASEHGRQLAALRFLDAKAEANLRDVLTPEQRQRLDQHVVAARDGKNCRSAAP